LLSPTGTSPDGVITQARFMQDSSPSGMSVYRFIDDQDEHFFIFSEDKSWTFHEWKSDAEFLYYSSTGGKLDLLVFCNGTHVEYRGNRIVSTAKRVLRCEIVHSHGKTKVLCSEDDIVVSQEGMSIAFETGETVAWESGEADR
jgi:hypothetical protein